MHVVFGLAVVVGFLTFILTVFRDIDLGMIFNLDAFLIVIGGTGIAILVGFPIKRVKQTIEDVLDTFKTRVESESVIRDIVSIARVYGRVDIRSIEARVRELNYDFLKRGLHLLLNRHDDEMIRSILEREMMIRMINYNFSQNLLKTIARLTPSLGLAGTVISLIGMFNNFKSIEDIAPLMAVALMSTLYGVIISNILVLPLSAKLKERAIMSEALMNITIEGVIAINNMEHPLKIEERLGGYQWMDDFDASEVSRELAVARGGNV